MLVIPAIDIYENKVVRLKKGDYNKVTEYQQTLKQTIEEYNSFGFKRIHIIDLGGSRDGEINLFDELKEIICELKIHVQFGGGIRKLKDVESLINIGVQNVIIGSLPFVDQEEFKKIIDNVNKEKIILAADVLDENVMIKGWKENSNKTIYDFIKENIELGIDQYLCTDIKRDGMLTGIDVELYNNLHNSFPKIKTIVSGGVKNIDDVKTVSDNKLYGMVIGKALFENRINLKELKEFDY